MTNIDFNNLEARTKPRDKAWENWSKFQNVGDSYQGFIRDVFFKKGSADFPDQRVLTLEQPDGEFVNVGIKHIDFVLEKTNDLRLGDPVKVVYSKSLPPQIKGHSATKQFEFYGQNMPENATNPTVLELEVIDRKAVEATATSTPVQTASSPVASGDAPVQATPAQPAANDLPFESNQPQPTAPPVATAVAPTTAAPVAPVAQPTAPAAAPVAPTPQV
jgi:hypothetical protein